MKRAISLAIAVTFGLIVSVLGSFAEPQASGTATKKTAPTANPKGSGSKPAASEEYHAVDPQKAGFKLVLNVSDITRNLAGEIPGATVNSLVIDDVPSSAIEGHQYPVELVSEQVRDSTIHTKTFGDFKIASASGFPAIQVMMKDSQIGKIQAFLKTKKN